MSRLKQDGLKYFSLDTDFFADKSIKRLHTTYGNSGVLFYIYLLTEIYKNGYYMKWDEDSVYDAMALNLTEGFIEQVMSFLAKREIIVRIDADGLNGPDTVITSPGIQKRYQKAVKGLKRDVLVDADIWLLEEDETASFIKVIQKSLKSEKRDDKSRKNNNKSEKNDINIINKKKEKEIEEIKEIKKSTPSAVGASTYYPDEPLNQAFLDFMEMRKKIRKPMTDRAVSLAMNKLRELAQDDNGKMDNDIAIRILDQSTMNCWQGLFPLRDERQKSGGIQSESDWIQKWRDA